MEEEFEGRTSWKAAYYAEREQKYHFAACLKAKEAELAGLRHLVIHSDVEFLKAELDRVLAINAQCVAAIDGISAILRSHGLEADHEKSMVDGVKFLSEQLKEFNREKVYTEEFQCTFSETDDKIDLSTTSTKET